MEGKIVIAGLEQEPALPKLNIATLGRELHPKLPEDLVKDRS